jgi:hypothetical protein
VPVFRPVAAGLLILLVSPVVLQAQNAADRSVHTLRAVRASEKILIDGVLNDKAWESAPPATEFTQRDPDEGKAPTERTELRIAYDDTSIYFGVQLFDSAPQKIVRRLSRRDESFDADSVTIQLSPYHDHLTGAVFEVSAAGAQRDAIISNDTNTDYSWEGVWESAVRITDEGWTAELRIPFSQLRFPASARQVWGINAARFILRKNETAWLQLVPKNETGLASRMDDLEGLDGIESRRHLDLLPYVASRTELIQPSSGHDPFNDGSRQFAAIGLDIKDGLTSNVTLDATINPDFGQVEVDPAVVNLSVFETFFPEKRPFFLEGANIFENFGAGGATNAFGFNRAEPGLFYSRRIGRAPQGVASGDFVDRPPATTILGAGKLTGKTGSGWTFGLIEAATSREYAEVSTGNQTSSEEVEPLTNYVVARVQREKGRGGFGLLTTGVQRDLREPALRDLLTKQAAVVGGDGYFFLDSKRDWVVNGKLSASRVSGSRAALDLLQHAPQHYFQRPDTEHVRLQPGLTSMRGWTGSVNLNKNQGNMTINAALWGVSPGFESNDLGFQTGGDVAGAHFVWIWKKPTPDRLTRERSVFVAKSWTWNYGRQRLHDGMFVFGNATLLNYWSLYGNLGLFRQVHDDHFTRGGPIVLSPAAGFTGLGVNTDERKKISFNVGSSYSWNSAGGWDYSGNLGVTLKPGPSISISTGPEILKSRNVAQYVTSVTDLTAVNTLGGRYVFADLGQSQVSLTTRANWILSSKISLQVFAQPLISVGRYWDFKELAQPNTFSFSRYGYDMGSIDSDASRQFRADPDADGPAPSFTFSDPSFNFKSLRVNTVFRWEWKLGSTLYLVWTENREDFSDPGQFSPKRDATRLFTAHPDDTFLVRVSYWFTR